MYDQKIYIKKCSEKYLREILLLQKEIIERLNDRSILRENSKDIIFQCFKSPNLVLGFFYQELLIAVGIFVDAAGSEEDLSINLKKNLVRNPANIKLILVKKGYRGNNLQKKLMWIIEKYAYHNGYTDLCLTVSPKNIYSVHNIEQMNYTFDHESIKYNNLDRGIYIKNIHKSISKYNKFFFRIAMSLEGKCGGNDLILEGINLSFCYKGEMNIATTGDILEYYDTDSGELFYGILFKKFTPMVLIYIPEIKNIKLIDFDECICSLRLRQVLINTQGGYLC